MDFHHIVQSENIFTTQDSMINLGEILAAEVHLTDDERYVQVEVRCKLPQCYNLDAYLTELIDCNLIRYHQEKEIIYFEQFRGDNGSIFEYKRENGEAVIIFIYSSFYMNTFKTPDPRIIVETLKYIWIENVSFNLLL
jgi:hypothetical protein